MRNLQPSQPSLRGTLLVAHPTLDDPNFQQTVILMSAHSETDGALGVILNRPTGVPLGALRERLSDSPLGEIPVYEGGPVAPEDVLLAAWKWDNAGTTFRLYFGISEAKLTELMSEDAQLEVRAFRGYAGWSSGQVEGELAEQAWVVAPLCHEYLEANQAEQWQRILRREDPLLGFQAGMPDDPSLN